MNGRSWTLAAILTFTSCINFGCRSLVHPDELQLKVISLDSAKRDGRFLFQVMEEDSLEPGFRYPRLRWTIHWPPGEWKFGRARLGRVYEKKPPREVIPGTARLLIQARSPDREWIDIFSKEFLVR